MPDDDRRTAVRAKATALSTRRRRCGTCAHPRAPGEIRALLDACAAEGICLPLNALHSLVRERVPGYVGKITSFRRHIQEHEPELWAQHYER